MMKNLGIPLTIKNIRPLIFLCGPYFDKNNRYDRRNIIKSYINTFKVKDQFEPFVLIVDNLLDPDKSNLALLEEIIAECSEKIYIFLDTMSASLELGLFSSAYKENNITVFLPKDYQFFKPSIGTFITKTLVQSKSIKVVQYPNKRYNDMKTIDKERIVYENLISFNKNKIPKAIASTISDDIDLIRNNSIQVDFDINNLDRKKIGVIIKKGYVQFKVPTNILLYLIYNSINIDDMTNHLLTLFLSFNAPYNEPFKIYYLYERGNLKVDILTFFNYEFERVFNEVKEMLRSIRFDILNKNYFYLRYDIHMNSYFRNRISIDKILGLDEKAYMLMNSYLKKPSKYIDKKKIIINGKCRNIVSYKGNSFGFELRTFHEMIALNLSEIFSFSDNVYGYIKGKSIQACLRKHKDDIYFLKLDIKDFFNSISKTKLNTIFRILLTTKSLEEAKFLFRNRKYKETRIIDDITGYQKILSSCCVSNKIPLGFSSSPVLSNIYLMLFDSFLEEKLKGLHYSRYADDILISSDRMFDISEIKNLVSHELKEFSLVINEKKVHTFVLNKRGDHVKFLGINIIKDKYENKLTIGHKYLMETSRLLFECVQYENVSKEKVVGRIEFIKSTSEFSYIKLLKIIKVKTGIDFDLGKFKRDEIRLEIDDKKELVTI